MCWMFSVSTFMVGIFSVVSLVHIFSACKCSLMLSGSVFVDMCICSVFCVYGYLSPVANLRALFCITWSLLIWVLERAWVGTGG